MNRPGRRARRTATVAALVTMVAFPLAALRLAPPAHADGSPGANLAGVNATATATGLLASPLTPGLVGAGNVTKGNLIEAAIPYATSSTSTGPSNSGLASPAYPGGSASQLGNLMNTFSPLPAPVETALNDPVLARSDYPAQVAVGSSGSYAPPTGAGAGLITATSDSTPGGTTSGAALSQTSLPGSLITIGSSTARTTTELGASSVRSTGHTDIGRISLLGGMVVIAGLQSNASASSDGNNGEQNSYLKVGQVTVAGQQAYIGPDGIHVGGAGQGATLVPAVNQVLDALAQAGISVRTIAPTSQTDGAAAQVTSGALQISFLDQHIPNPNGILPISTIGLDLDIGVTSASADATALPPFDASTGSAIATFGAGPTGTGAALVAGGSGSGLAPTGLGSAASPPPGLAAGTTTPGATGPALGGPAGPVGGTGSATAGSPSGALSAPQPAAVLGAPVKVAWVVIAFLLSLVLAGPLLGYANWQLLRGRKS